MATARRLMLCRQVGFSRSETDDFLYFQWTENGGVIVEAPEKRTVGSVLIEPVAAECFGGGASRPRLESSL